MLLVLLLLGRRLLQHGQFAARQGRGGLQVGVAQGEEARRGHVWGGLQQDTDLVERRNAIHLYCGCFYDEALEDKKKQKS